MHLTYYFIDSNAQFKDAGGYECQIGLTPRISHYIHLSIVGNSFFIIEYYSCID